MSHYTCDCCGCELDEHCNCPACQIYNAAVAAQREAAREIASARCPGSRDAWLNKSGVYAYSPAGFILVLGSPEEAAPFAALTSVARAVARPQPSVDALNGIR